MKKFISTVVAAIAMAVVMFNLSSCGDTSMARLQAEVDNFNKNEAPQDCGNGVTMTNCKLDDAKHLLVFNFTLNESMFTAEDLQPVMGEFKTAMANELVKSKDGEKLAKLLSDVDYGMQFVIKGAGSGKSVESTITAAEVKKMTGAK